MAKHADIVLPATITLERADIGSGRGDTHILPMRRSLAPYGQARDDYAIFTELAARLGVRSEFTEDRTERQWLTRLYDQWRAKLGPDGAGLPDFAEFWAGDGIRLPLPEYRDTLFAKFREDPEAHPLRTPSGRIEVSSATIGGFGYPDCPGHPVWLEPREWLGSDRAARFPLHLVANQPAARLHSQLDMGAISQASKVAGREPIRLHPQDAAARGLADGDVVRVFNDRGACLAGLRISEAVRPGVAHLSTGAWYDPADDETGPLCRNGNPNVLTQDVGTSRLAQGSTGQHCLVEVERYPGAAPEVHAYEPPDFVLPADGSCLRTRQVRT
jgi:biotin/methionine sulfoxide reductase